MPSCPICQSSPWAKTYYSCREWMVLRCSYCTFAWGVDLVKPRGKPAWDWNLDIMEESGKRLPRYRDRLVRISNFRLAPVKG